MGVFMRDPKVFFRRSLLSWVGAFSSSFPSSPFVGDRSLAADVRMEGRKESQL